MTVQTASLGFPRIGARRELKKALENFWAGAMTEKDLHATASSVRAASWAMQRKAGADILPSNDFSLYDHVLDTSFMLGVVPEIYKALEPEGALSLKTYFAMARGIQNRPGKNDQGEHEQGDKQDTPSCGCGHGHADIPASEMTKWFDTNYHYLVPEFQKNQKFSLASTKIIDEYKEARAQGYETRPVLLGPVSFLLLGKMRDVSGAHGSALDLLEGVLPVYEEILARLQREGADWVQIDEPGLVLDLDEQAYQAFRLAYKRLKDAAPGLKIMLTAWFGPLEAQEDLALSLPVDGLHLDLIRGPEQLDSVLSKASPDLLLSLGVVDGRNVWRADLPALLEQLAPVAAERNLVLAPSCSLLHCPIDLQQEDAIEPEIKEWLAFAVQKIEELAVLAKALNHGQQTVSNALEASKTALAKRRIAKRIHQPAVRERLERDDPKRNPRLARRQSPFAERQKVQQAELNLPLYPTTTIGSFPQTPEIRRARADYAKSALSEQDYNSFLERETATAISWQEEAGLDVLVHGEFERNDMVQYFGERLSGFVFTKHAWVQSYGSRYVRPPILFGDVSRPKPMTLDWWRFAQSCSDKGQKKPVKGMLTGPVTILNWSFVRDDQPRSETCRQLALALRDEVTELEKAGCRIIQIDEAALREGLPLRRRDWQAYLDWAVECFRLTASGVGDSTQIHTHMCYSEFNDIIDSISAMDADVISVETARSKMELLDVFTHHHYPAEIGPGVYDIHSPRVPSVEEILSLLTAAEEKIPARNLWVNPDCGLKTRRWAEVKPSIAHMVQAAKEMRKHH